VMAPLWGCSESERCLYAQSLAVGVWVWMFYVVLRRGYWRMPCPSYWRRILGAHCKGLYLDHVVFSW
jgi:hypothetical protein